MTPLDSMKPLFIIDDLHLEDHLTSNISEFLRMWENYGGYYNIENGHFINIENLRVLCSRNPRMLKNKKNIDRFTYYINTIYFDELDNDRFRMFVQEWLTNKSWSTSKLVNKYILITNSLMSIKEKISKNEKFSESLRLKKFSLHHFVRLLSNFSIFTLMLDEENSKY